MSQFIPSILKDLDFIYTQAIENGNLSIALKVKELQLKEITQKTAFSLTDLSDEALDALLNRLLNDQKPVASSTT